MVLHFHIAPAADPVTIHLQGGLTLGPQLLDFGRQAAQLLRTRRPAGVLLDLAAVTDIDSAGLGELVILYTLAGQHGGHLCLVRPPERIVRLLETTKLSGILPHYDDEAAGRAWLATLP